MEGARDRGDVEGDEEGGRSHTPRFADIGSEPRGFTEQFEKKAALRHRQSPSGKGPGPLSAGGGGSGSGSSGRSEPSAEGLSDMADERPPPPKGSGRGGGRGGGGRGGSGYRGGNLPIAFSEDVPEMGPPRKAAGYGAYPSRYDPSPPEGAPRAGSAYGDREQLALANAPEGGRQRSTGWNPILEDPDLYDEYEPGGRGGEAAAPQHGRQEPPPEHGTGADALPPAGGQGFPRTELTFGGSQAPQDVSGRFQRTPVEPRQEFSLSLGLAPVPKREEEQEEHGHGGQEGGEGGAGQVVDPEGHFSFIVPQRGRLRRVGSPSSSRSPTERSPGASPRRRQQGQQAPPARKPSEGPVPYPAPGGAAPPPLPHGLSRSPPDSPRDDGLRRPLSPERGPELSPGAQGVSQRPLPLDQYPAGAVPPAFRVGPPQYALPPGSGYGPSHIRGGPPGPFAPDGSHSPRSPRAAAAASAASPPDLHRGHFPPAPDHFQAPPQDVLRPAAGDDGAPADLAPARDRDFPPQSGMRGPEGVGPDYGPGSRRPPHPLDSSSGSVAEQAQQRSVAAVKEGEEPLPPLPPPPSGPGGAAEQAAFGGRKDGSPFFTEKFELVQRGGSVPDFPKPRPKQETQARAQAKKDPECCTLL